MTHKIINSYYSTDKGWNNAYYHECDNGQWIKHELGMAMGQPEKVSFITSKQAIHEMNKHNCLDTLISALGVWDKKSTLQYCVASVQEKEYITDYLTNALYKYTVLSNELIEIKPFK